MMSFSWGRQGGRCKGGDGEVVPFGLAAERRSVPPADDWGTLRSVVDLPLCRRAARGCSLSQPPGLPLAKQTKNQQPNVVLFGLEAVPASLAVEDLSGAGAPERVRLERSWAAHAAAPSPALTRRCLRDALASVLQV